MSGNGRGRGRDRYRTETTTETCSCNCLGHPCGCKGCNAGCCDSMWIGDSPTIGVFFNILFILGAMAFLTGLIGMQMHAQAIFQPTLNPLPFAGAHSCNTCALWNLWVPSVMLGGSTALMFASMILVFGGLHANGFCWWAGTCAFMAANIMQIYYGTDSSRFNGDNLQTALWVYFSGWGIIILGFVISAMTGLTPLPKGVYGWTAYWSRGGKTKRKFGTYKRSEAYQPEQELNDWN